MFQTSIQWPDKQMGTLFCSISSSFFNQNIEANIKLKSLPSKVGSWDLIWITQSWLLKLCLEMVSFHLFCQKPIKRVPFKIEISHKTLRSTSQTVEHVEQIVTNLINQQKETEGKEKRREGSTHLTKIHYVKKKEFDGFFSLFGKFTGI